uniref:Uncharacterized protein n=1 Tax=Pinctada fucata TaxID=50426 RepID=A0A194ALF1_PINFU
MLIHNACDYGDCENYNSAMIFRIQVVYNTSSGEIIFVNSRFITKKGFFFVINNNRGDKEKLHIACTCSFRIP